MRVVRYSGIIRLIKILCHCTLVLLLAGFPAALYYQTKKAVIPHGNPLESPYYWLFVLSFTGFFYGFTYFLIPRFLLKKKYLAFWGCLFLVFAGFYLVKPTELFFSEVLLPLQGQKPHNGKLFSLDFFTLVIFAMIAALGLAIQIVKQWRLSEKRALLAETEKANAELSFLKAQVNPHFLFNTLSTLYTLIISKNEQAGDVVLKLSNIMRYITDDATTDFVTLEKEVAFITDYINLQRLQHGQKVQVDFSVTGNLEGKEIAPLILLTYIENAFKYGLSTRETALITVRLEAKEDQVEFFCQNRLFATPRVTERTGIGLQNTQKRLAYIYPGKHTLTTSASDAHYTVSLILVTA